MKIQDIFFLVLSIVLIILPSRWTKKAGYLCFVLAGVLFLLKNLFTAQRLTWYAAAFIALYCIKQIIQILLTSKKDNLQEE